MPVRGRARWRTGVRWHASAGVSGGERLDSGWATREAWRARLSVRGRRRAREVARRGAPTATYGGGAEPLQLGLLGNAGADCGCRVVTGRELRLFALATRAWTHVGLSPYGQSASSSGVLSAARTALRHQHLVEFATHESHVLADAQARQPPFARVLQHGLGGNPAQQHADLTGGRREWLVERPELRGHHHSSRQGFQPGKRSELRAGDRRIRPRSCVRAAARRRQWSWRYAALLLAWPATCGLWSASLRDTVSEPGC
jgi:hypothetical protein